MVELPERRCNPARLQLSVDTGFVGTEELSGAVFCKEGRGGEDWISLGAAVGAGNEGWPATFEFSEAAGWDGIQEQVILWNVAPGTEEEAPGGLHWGNFTWAFKEVSPSGTI